MNDYTPKPGDSVKLTGKKNPENVLFGTFQESGKLSFSFKPDGVGSSNRYIESDWSIEPWVKPVTFKPFAVVRLPEGWGDTLRYHESGEQIVLVRTGIKRWANELYGPFYDADIAKLLRHGAEILFEGVEL